ncbi:hypothetical protein GC197_17835 [bacterium]|nr:hypothetical protein [bacterium]
MMLRVSLPSCAILLAMVLGCTSEPPAKPPTNGSNANAANSSGDGSAQATASAPSLAPAGEKTPPLDGGKVQSTLPEGWSFLPRSNSYLFAAYFEDKAGVPRLVLRKSDADGLPATTSGETADKLVDKILSEVKNGNEAAVTKVDLGGKWYVRYEKVMRFQSQSARGVIMETVQGGSRFTIELLTFTDDKDKFIPALYRFAAELTVQNDEAAPMESKDSDAADKPADGDKAEADKTDGEKAAGDKPEADKPDSPEGSGDENESKDASS